MDSMTKPLFLQKFKVFKAMMKISELEKKPGNYRLKNKF